MQNYLDLLQNILDHGIKKEDRTGVGTLSIFGTQLRWDLSAGFPLVTTKKTWFKGVVHELLWMLAGDTNIKYLVDNNVHIWDEWADENGDLGNVYGRLWRQWGYGSNNEVDQLASVIEQIKVNPNSRRHIVTAWDPNALCDVKLPPCHYSFQFNVVNNKLSCMFNQRSQDEFLGAPFNIASYALLTHLVAQVCGLAVGDLIMSVGDAHIYLNHINQVKEQLSRIPFNLPTIHLNPAIKNIDDFKYEDITLENYVSHPAIKAPIAV